MPIPVHIAYAVPSGSCFKASERKNALAIYPTPVIIDGTRTVKHSDIFIATAHVTSKTPAKIRYTHFIINSP